MNHSDREQKQYQKAQSMKQSLRARLMAAGLQKDSNSATTNSSSSRLNSGQTQNSDQEKVFNQALEKLKQRAIKIQEKVETSNANNLENTLENKPIQTKNQLEKTNQNPVPEKPEEIASETSQAQPTTGINPVQFQENNQPEIQTQKLQPSDSQEKLAQAKNQVFNHSFQNDPNPAFLAKLNRLKNLQKKSEPAQTNWNQAGLKQSSRFNFNPNPQEATTNQNFFQNQNFNPAIQTPIFRNPDSNFINQLSFKRAYQLDKFQKLSSLKNGKIRSKRLPTKQYQIKKPNTRFNLNLDNNYKLLLTNIVSYSLILVVLIAGFYLTFSSSGSPTKNQVLGASEETGSVELEEESQSHDLPESSNIPSEQILEIENKPLEYDLSSQAASLQIALNYFDIQVSQDEILEKIGYTSPLQPQRVGQEIIWGNPEEGFVGRMDGYFGSSQTSGIEYSTGWGAGSDPVARVAKQYLENSEKLKDGSISEIKKSLAQGKPILIWHQPIDSRSETLTIKTNQGKRFELRDHTVSLLIGYQEGQDETTYFLNNPKKGQIKLDQTELINQWAKMNRQAVVIAGN